MNKFTLIQKERKITGSGQVERIFLDLSFDGLCFTESADFGDFITGKGWQTTEQQERYISNIINRFCPDLKNGRVPILICPECADLGCGAVTCKIQRLGDILEFTEIGFQNNYEDNVCELKKYSHLKFSTRAKGLFDIFTNYKDGLTSH